MGKKGDLSDFECGMVVGARRAGLSISKTADLLEFSHTTISRVYREWSEQEKIPSERQLCGWKRRLKFTQAHQNWTIEDWKTIAWSDESRFLLRHSDGRVRIWCKEHPSCLVSMVQAGGGGVMVYGIFSWHTLGPLVPIEHCLNATAYLSIVADHVSIPLWLQCTHLLMATSSRIMHHVTKLKSSQTGFLNMTMSSLYSNNLHSHQISIQ